MGNLKAHTKRRGHSTPGLKCQNKKIKTKAILSVNKRVPVSECFEGNDPNLSTASTSSYCNKTSKSKRIKSRPDTSRGSDLYHNEVDSTSSGSESDFDDSKVPSGWSRKVRWRKTNGNTKGKFEVHFYTPSRRRLCSRNEVVAFLEIKNINLDINRFDFTVREKPNKKKTSDKKTALQGTSSKKSIISMKQDVSQDLPLKLVKNGVEPVLDEIDVPKGWRRVIAKSNSGAKVRYYSPDGEEIRSMKGVRFYLSKNKQMGLDPCNFDFTVRRKRCMQTPTLKSFIKEDSSSLAAIIVDLEPVEVNEYTYSQTTWW